MTSRELKTLILKTSLDEGMPTADNFEVVTSQIDLTTLQEGEVALELKVISADPFQRTLIKPFVTGREVKQGSAMIGFVGGTVLASKNEAWVEGDLFGAFLPYQTVQIVTPAMLAQTSMWKLTGLIDESEISLSIGVLGMPGATAYGGLVEVLRPSVGETIFISAASGAVGALVGMIAKRNYACRVIGSCGGPSKAALVKESFGFDEVIDYKTVSNAAELTEKLKEAALGGIDMYFESVGGMHFEAAMATLRPRGRVALCGQISEYNSAVPALCSFDPMHMIYTGQRIEGFVSTTWLSDPKKVFLHSMHAWLREGKLQVQETKHSGLESWPAAFQSLFTGANVGKVVVEV